MRLSMSHSDLPSYYCEHGGHRGDVPVFTEAQYLAILDRDGRVWCDPCEARPESNTIPAEAATRKTYPVASGVLDYFPDALAAVAHVSFVGNEQHNPGTPLHWDRSKSTDEADALIRHFLQRGTADSDGLRHSAKMAWRALALLQKEIEAENAD